MTRTCSCTTSSARAEISRRDPPHSSIDRLKSDTESAYLPVTALFECAYTCQTTYQVPNDVLARLFLDILGFPGVVSDQKDALMIALELWRSQGPLSFADCYHLALTRKLGMTEIYTFDRKMDRFPGVTRVEP